MRSQIVTAYNTDIMQLPVIHNKIYEIRDQKVMFDFDFAALYEVETRILNQAIKRNINRFPKDFMFQLTKKEWEVLKPQALISNDNNSSQIVMSYNGQLNQIYDALENLLDDKIAQKKWAEREPIGFKPNTKKK